MEQADFDRAIYNYREYRSPSSAQALYKIAHAMLLEAWRVKNFLPAVGPVTGIFDEVNVEFHQSRLIRAWIWWAKRSLKPERPGWNDYWMTRWFIGRSPEALREIHRRAEHLDFEKNPDAWMLVRDTARWMVASVCEQNPDFAAAYREARAGCAACSTLNGRK